MRCYPPRLRRARPQLSTHRDEKRVENDSLMSLRTQFVHTSDNMWDKVWNRLNGGGGSVVGVRLMVRARVTGPRTLFRVYLQQ